MLLNFGFLYFAIILVAFHVPPLFVTVTIGITILAITIFMGEDDLRTTVTAFYASLIVLCLILVLIFIVEHWAMVQGFGTEDSDELEGMSILIGISYFKVSVTTTILSRNSVCVVTLSIPYFLKVCSVASVASRPIPSSSLSAR